MIEQLGYLNDLWKFDLTHKLWAWVSGESKRNNRGIYTSQGSEGMPGARSSHGMVIDHLKGAIYLFGGTGYDKNLLGIGKFERKTDSHLSLIGVLNDLWKYNLESNQWIWLKGDFSKDSLGYYGERYIASPRNVPGARTGASLSFDMAGQLLFVFGGLGYTNTPLSYGTHTIIFFSRFFKCV